MFRRTSRRTATAWRSQAGVRTGRHRTATSRTSWIPRKILPQGNSNYGACSDPHITSLIQTALKQTSPAAEYPYWQQVDQTVLKDACDAPFTYDKALDLFSSRLKNVYIEPQFGIVDLRTVGVALTTA